MRRYGTEMFVHFTSKVFLEVRIVRQLNFHPAISNVGYSYKSQLNGPRAQMHHSRQLLWEGFVCPFRRWEGRMCVRLLRSMLGIFNMVRDVVGCSDAGGQVNRKQVELCISRVRNYCL